MTVTYSLYIYVKWIKRDFKKLKNSKELIFHIVIFSAC